jgi:Ankyrin repeats (many copies)
MTDVELSIIAEMMKQSKQPSKVVKSNTTGSIGIDKHIADLHSECERMAQDMSNPFTKHSFHQGMKEALEQLRESHKHLRDHEVAERFQPCANNWHDTLSSSAPALLTTFSRSGRLLKRNAQYFCQCETRTVFGKVQFRSQKLRIYAHSEDDNIFLGTDQYEYHTSFIFHPSESVMSLGAVYGFRFSLSRSNQGLERKLCEFRAVQDDSLIFKFCRDGDLDNVKLLLSNGQASVFDTDSDGYTPLHVSTCFFSQLSLISQLLKDTKPLKLPISYFVKS